MAIKFLFLIRSLFYIKLNKNINFDIKEMDIFSEEFDEIWENSKKHNFFIAVRNHKYLKTLYSDKRFIKLKFLNNNKIIGWSISLCTKLKNHKQFGNMQLGSIVDCLSLKGHETSIINKTSEVLKGKGADLIVSNQSHIFWKNAFKKNVFVQGVSNFIFATSETLNDKLKNEDKKKNYMHITRADGDGPINL